MSIVPYPVAPFPRRNAALESDVTRFAAGLAGDTVLLTRRAGPVPLELLRDQTATVLTDAGWQTARVVCLGRGRAVALTLVPVQASATGRAFRSPTPARLRHTIVVAADHAWAIAAGTRHDPVAVGDHLARIVAPLDPITPAAAARAPADVQAGLRHGLVFGDGARGYRHRRTPTATFHLRLCGPKAALAPLFAHEPVVVTHPPSAQGDPVVTIRSGVDLKALPDPTAGAAYLAGFVRGWLRADGTADGAATVLATQDAAAADWLVAHAALAGLVALSDRVSAVTTTNLGPRSAPLHRVRLTAAPGAWRVAAVAPVGGAIPLYAVQLARPARVAVGPGVGVGTLLRPENA